MNIANEDMKPMIERHIHCPYCQSEEALLISQPAEKISTIQLPAFGKKFVLSTLFTFGLYPLVHGYPYIEKKRTYEYHSYGFCPYCGKTYNASLPQNVKITQSQSPKVYRSLYNKKILGICGGIAEFTGLSPTLVRIVMVCYGLWFFPAVLYFILGGLDIIPMNPAHLSQQQPMNFNQ